MLKMMARENDEVYDSTAQQDFEQTEYDICGHYLTAIFNDDYSGLDDEEEQELNEFLDFTHENIGNGHWSITSQESYFHQDDVSGLMADCYSCTYNVPVYS